MLGFEASAIVKSSPAATKIFCVLAGGVAITWHTCV